MAEAFTEERGCLLLLLLLLLVQYGVLAAALMPVAFLPIRTDIAKYDLLNSVRGPEAVRGSGH